MWKLVEPVHRDEVTVGVDMMIGLIGDQFPDWSHLPVRPVPSSGTDNTLFRVGEEFVARWLRPLTASRSIGCCWPTTCPDS